MRKIVGGRNICICESPNRAQAELRCLEFGGRLVESPDGFEELDGACLGDFVTREGLGFQEAIQGTCQGDDLESSSFGRGGQACWGLEDSFADLEGLTGPADSGGQVEASQFEIDLGLIGR